MPNTKQVAEVAPLRRRQPEEKRQRLVAAATELFASVGFEQTSTQQIARAAGVSEGILFHHFGSKRGLLVAVAEDFVRRSSEVTLPQGLERWQEQDVVRAAFDFADANPGLYRLLLEIGSYLDADEIPSGDLLIGRIRSTIERAQTHKAVRQGDAQILAELQFALVDGAYRAWDRSGDPTLREAYIEEATHGLRAMLSAKDWQRRQSNE